MYCAPTFPRQLICCCDSARLRNRLSYPQIIPSSLGEVNPAGSYHITSLEFKGLAPRSADPVTVVSVRRENREGRKGNSAGRRRWRQKRRGKGWGWRDDGGRGIPEDPRGLRTWLYDGDVTVAIVLVVIYEQA